MRFDFYKYGFTVFNPFGPVHWIGYIGAYLNLRFPKYEYFYFDGEHHLVHLGIISIGWGA